MLRYFSSIFRKQGIEVSIIKCIIAASCITKEVDQLLIIVAGVAEFGQVSCLFFAVWRKVPCC